MIPFKTKNLSLKSISEELIETLKSSPSLTKISDEKLTISGLSEVGITEIPTYKVQFLSPSETEIVRESSPEKFAGGEYVKIDGADPLPSTRAVPPEVGLLERDQDNSCAALSISVALKESN